MTDKKDITRRTLLASGAAGGALLGLGGLPAAFAQVKRDPKLLVPRRVLGKTGQKVPILLFGGSVELDRTFDPKLATAYRYGVDYIDAARIYGGGTCEPRVAAFHTRAKLRDKLWITTKSTEHEPEPFAKDVDRSLADLKTKEIDLYFMHMLQDAGYLNPKMAKTAERLKKAGKIRYFGFSCHHGNVAELLEKAAGLPWIDVIMFRYNFRQYGNKELNRAIDKAAKANIGLIAMKTQGSAVSFEDKWKKFEGRFTKHQAVLKAVWADERITAAVSHMDSMDKVRQNVAAALDKSKLSALELDQLDRYAAETRSYACDGCDHYCNAAIGNRAEIGDTMRFLMYHDVYGERDKAKRLFSQLPTHARDLGAIDFQAANAACPNGVDIVKHMRRAKDVLA